MMTAEVMNGLQWEEKMDKRKDMSGREKMRSAGYEARLRCSYALAVSCLGQKDALERLRTRSQRQHS